MTKKQLFINRKQNQIRVQKITQMSNKFFQHQTKNIFMNEPQDFLSTKVVFLSFAASLVTLAVAAGLTTGALCWGRFFLALIFCYIGEEMRIIYTISKKKITKKKKGRYLQFFLFWIMHHSMAPQAFLIIQSTNKVI